MAAGPRHPWIVLGKTAQPRWGGDLRRGHIFQALADATGATTSDRWDRRHLWASIRRTPGALLPWRRPVLAAAELLTIDAIGPARWLTTPAALDLHDEPVIQAAALGRAFEPNRAAELKRRVDRNLRLFPVHVVPSASFAELVGLDPARVLVAPNGADTAHVRPGPFPDQPTLGMVSAAAPSRGIETLVEAATRLRPDVPALRLILWLTATDSLGQAYIDRLRESVADRPWIQIGTAPYASLGEALAGATVLVVPHPPNAYLDVAVPVKLADSMAAGRPVVVTPRLEAARIVRAADCGAVAPDDGPDALAAAMRPILDDPALAARLGERARAAAVASFDWRVISAAVATEVLARTGRLGGRAA